ncbi:Bug family tripartite tricarboxylate transporter substrate binding protein [Dysosmobacter sp.]|uniref:Bug family tripartite tricarboxylate transporter substrate binding protein n=1 Tax=Dysosmobacter sp. TaxID=2591382 RepID=UPI002A8788BF|nr:tripartite tricarboxylate transporter substrate binding protein [Dysosmobacter sp.]MDY3986167.1 tripartite tricarboxylate transporter substrate binding protein [Dysosmobacter sp.]
MKKFFALALSLAMVLTMAACGAKETDAPASSDTKTPAQSENTGLDFPKKDITLIVPFDAGGGNDIYGRIVAKIAMEKGLFNGVNIIVENQPGGGGAIGQAYVANTAPADGYTLLTFTASGISNPILKDVPFTVEDFRPIICANSDPAVLIARADAPFDDVEGLIEYAKNNTLIINDSGFGTSSHVRTLDWTSKLEKITGEKINYQSIHVDSGSVQISELMGGHADLTCLTVGECADAILEGNIKGIAIMANDRYEGLPDVPTFKELGYEGFIDGADRAIACNSDVPEDVYNYLVEQFTILCNDEDFIKAMKDANLNPACKSAAEYQEFMDMKTELFNNLKDFLLAGEG